MKNEDDERLFTVEEFAKEFGKNWKVKEGQYVLVENRGTIAERTLNAYDTEIEAYKIKRKSNTNIDVVKANVRYVNLKGITFLYDYEEV